MNDWTTHNTIPEKPPAQARPPHWQALLERLEGAYAPATVQNYGKAIAAFVAFCESRGFASLPAEPDAVVAFIRHEAARLAPCTIRIQLAAIEKLHRLARLPSPVSDEDVKLAMRRINREKGRRPEQALALDADLRDTLLAACDADTLLGLRDRALLRVSYDTLCRRSELVALRVEDLAECADGGMIALVRRSKADQTGKGRNAYLAPGTATAIDAWRRKAKVAQGPLLRGIQNGKVMQRGLAAAYVPQILKRIAARAGLPSETIARLSGHSARVGAAQDLSLAGADILTIMRAGGWKTVHVVARYVEHAELRRSAARYRWDMSRPEGLPSRS